MRTITDALAGAIHLGDDGRSTFEARAELQSWPGIVHGGGLVAALDAAAARLGAISGPRHLEARLTSSVPVDTPLTLEASGRGGQRVTVSLLQDGQPLATSTVSARGAAPATERPSAPEAGERANGWPLPMSEHCLACGAQNPLGLQVRLAFDADGVWARLTPRPPWQVADGRVHPALAPVVLDEVAWWLGALVMKEGGLTNRIAVTLLDGALATEPGALVAVGRFEDVTPVDRKRSFWRTATTLATEDGRLLAVATVVFRGGREYSARQLDYFRSRSDAEVFRRMFPNYAGG